MPTAAPLLRLILFLAALMLAPFAAPAQEVPEPEAAGPRAETGGAPTLEDILARQRGQRVSDTPRLQDSSAAGAAAAIDAQLGTRGGVSDADLFRQIRLGTDDVTVSTDRPVDTVLIQVGGMRWLEWRRGPLIRYGILAIAGITALLAVFFLIRGRIRVESGRAYYEVVRFRSVERFGHWLLACSFVLLALTGLFTLLGRQYLIPLIGKEAYASAAAVSKWVHDNVAWAFMAGLVIVAVLWIAQNLPRRADLTWLRLGGGMFSDGTHAPAWKFNAGQKILFWAVILLGASVSLSGLSLLFPFELPLFAKTFGMINDLGGLVGLSPDLPADLAPHEEMQFSQLWHAIIGFTMMVVIIAHIYIGTIGMEGAFAAMGSGRVDLNWAREHHNLWAERLEGEAAQSDAAPRPSPAE